jgi:hypothetical protein
MIRLDGASLSLSSSQPWFVINVRCPVRSPRWKPSVTTSRTTRSLSVGIQEFQGGTQAHTSLFSSRGIWRSGKKKGSFISLSSGTRSHMSPRRFLLFSAFIAWASFLATARSLGTPERRWIRLNSRSAPLPTSKCKMTQIS